MPPVSLLLDRSRAWSAWCGVDYVLEVVSLTLANPNHHHHHYPNPNLNLTLSLTLTHLTPLKRR